MKMRIAIGIILAVSCCFGQIMSTTQKGALVPNSNVYASRPGSPVTGQVFIMTDTDCGGTPSATPTQCRWSGTVWQATGGSGSGGGGSPLVTPVAVASSDTSTSISYGTTLGSGSTALPSCVITSSGAETQAWSAVVKTTTTMTITWNPTAGFTGFCTAVLGGAAGPTGPTGSAGVGFTNFTGVADYVALNGCSIASSSSTLTCATASFVPGDVGKTISVQGAGSSNSLVTTIASRSSSTVVVLTLAASTSVTSALVEYGTDNYAALTTNCDAIKSAGGGWLHVPKGDYLIGAYESIHDYSSFCDNASNYTLFGDANTASVMHFVGSKGVFMSSSYADINRYCTAPPSTGCTPQDWGLPTYYLIGNVSTGSSVTTSTHAQAANFTAGGIVFIESGDASSGTGHPPKHFEYNVVVSANASTGVVTLLNPLSDGYDSSDATYPPMMAQIGTVPSNITIRDMGFTASSVSPVILASNGTRFMTIDNCIFTALGVNQGTFGPEIWNGYSWYTAIKNSQLSGVSGDWGDAPGYFSVIRNTFTGTKNITQSGAGRNYNIDSNIFTGFILDMQGSASSQLRKTSVTNNTFQLSSVAGFPGGISTAYNDYPNIQNNKCIGVVDPTAEAGCITASTGTVGGIVGNNTVDGTNVKWGYHSTGGSGVLVSGNTFNNTTFGVRLESGFTGLTIGCNTYNSVGTSISGYDSSTSLTCPITAPTSNALKGDGAGNIVAVTGTGTNCVQVNGSSTSCGGGGISGLTTGVIPKAASSTTLADSGFSDNGTTISTTEALVAGSITTGGATSACNGTAGCIEMGQGTAPSGLPTTGIQSIAPTGVTSYRHVWPTTGATGFRFWTLSSTTATESILADPLVPAHGGTGVANGTNNTLTYTGNFTLGLTLSGNTALTLPTSGTVCTTITCLPLSGGTLTGNLLFTDNTLDIGATAATRPRTLYLGTSLRVQATTNQAVYGASTNLTTVNWPASSGAVTVTMPNTTTTVIGQSGSDTTTTHVLHASATGGIGTFGAIAAGDLPSTLTSGTAITNAALTTPAIGAATGTSLLATGIIDGTAPVTITTGTTGSPGATYNSGYTFNQEATAGTGVTYTLPTAAAGKQYCMGNSYNGSAANTGVLTIATSASGQFIIFTDGTLSATGGNVTSGGAAGDFACVVGVDSTHWYLRPGAGTWTKH